MAKYGLGMDHRLIALLRALEAWSIRRADLVLTPNLAFRALFVGRGCPEDRVSRDHEFPRSVDLRGLRAGHARFHAEGERLARAHVPRDDRGTARPGDGAGGHGDRAAAVPDVRFEVYGEGDFVDAFLERRASLGLEDVVFYRGFVPLEHIAEAIRSIHVGLIPNLRNVFTDINLPTRILEYLACGKHVIAPDTRGIRDYFDASSMHFFEAGDAGSLAQAILRIHRGGGEAAAVLAAGREVYLRHAWPQESARLVDLYRGLLGKKDRM